MFCCLLIRTKTSISVCLHETIVYTRTMRTYTHQLYHKNEITIKTVGRIRAPIAVRQKITRGNVVLLHQGRVCANSVVCKKTNLCPECWRELVRKRCHASRTAPVAVLHLPEAQHVHKEAKRMPKYQSNLKTTTKQSSTSSGNISGHEAVQ